MITIIIDDALDKPMSLTEIVRGEPDNTNELNLEGQTIESVTERLQCSNPNHQDFDNKVRISKHGRSFKVDACCDEFERTIEVSLNGDY